MPGVVLLTSNPSELASSLRRWTTRILAVARAAFCLFIVVAILVAGCLRSAHAHLGESLLGFGDQLAKWQGVKALSGRRQLNVNGLALGLMTLSTDLDVTHVLDRFQDLCRKRGGLAVPASLAKKLGSGARAFDGSFRQESAAQGVLACLDSDHPLTLSELGERLTRLRDTGDLAALGDLRYVLARRSGDTTTLLVFWTEGSAPLFSLFPKTGDALGRDPKDLPRPPTSQRMLSAAEQGAAPYSLTLYRVANQTPEQLRQWYRRELENSGWRVVHDSSSRTLHAQRPGRSLLVTFTSSTTSGAVATVAELE
jgi:hypothetical protein